jgi:hypothetical protein
VHCFLTIEDLFFDFIEQKIFQKSIILPLFSENQNFYKNQIAFATGQNKD